MPGKGSKSPRNKSPKNAKGDAGIAWETLVTASSINQDNWTTFVCFLMPDCAINQIYVDLIEKAMQHNIRRRFDLISKRDFIEAIKKVEKQTKNAAKSVSTNSFVDSLNNSAFVSAYDHAKTLLEAGSEIDDQLWAKLIKCRILDLKKEVQARTVTKTSGAQAAAAPAKPEKGKGGKKSPKVDKKKQAAVAAPPPVSDTHIEKPPGVKTRDQITDETKYVDDEPNDGPNQYIYLSGFYSIGLLHALDDVSIRIDTITNVSSDNLDETNNLFEEMIRRDRQEQTLKSDVLKEIQKDSIPTPEQIAEQNQKNDQVLNTFWSSLMPILDNAPDQSMLQDVIVTTLKVPYEQLPDSWINTEQKFRLADSLCENVVDNSFRLNVRKRQFKSFNEQMKVVAIPVIEEKTSKSTLDAQIYTEITTVIPPESISVPLILHGILEQVEAKLVVSTNNNSNASNPSEGVGRYLRDRLMSLSMGKQQQKEIENLVPKSPFSKPSGSGPKMVYYGDEIKQRLTTLNCLALFDPIKVERDSLMAHSRLVNLPEMAQRKPYDPDEKERQTRMNQFLQFCVDDELLPTDVDHILKQFVFECISLNPMKEGKNEQQASRPSSAGSLQEDDQYDLEKRLTYLNDDESQSSNIIQPIVWDDPYELLRTNQETGRIGLESLVRPSSASSHSSNGSTRRSRTQSPKSQDNNLQQQLPHILPPIGNVHVDGTIQAVLQHHKRNLNDWNFAEHFEPDIFLQIIEQALFTHSHVDVYYNRRDQTHMIVLSLPIPTDKTIGHQTTSKKLFSDVGFRNFLDEISYEIVDWLRDEEAKYHADVLAKEVQTYVRETTPTPDAGKPAAGAGKKGKGAGKKTPPARSRSTSVSSEAGNTTAEDEQTIRDDYAHPTSLKAWKQKRDKEIQEEELAKAKRAESATKRGKTKTPRGSEKPGKEASPHDKSSKDSKLKQQTNTASIDKPPETQPPPPPTIAEEPVERFTGYSLGNHLLSAQCNTTHLLLPDGCFVRTHVDSLKRGSTCVSASLYRNKSAYTVQLINPNKSSHIDSQHQGQSQSSELINANETSQRKENNATDSTEEKRVAQYGVFTAILNSGMIVSCSNYDTKAPKSETPAVAAPPPPPVPAPLEHANSEVIEEKKKDSHAAKGKKKVKPVEVEVPLVEKPPPEPQYEPEPFQRLTISIPTGLVVTYYPETFLGVKPTQEKQPHRLAVKQYYACQSKGFHTCEQSRLNAYEESSRIIDGEGHVMIFKRNGELIILQPDGGIFSKTIVYQNEPEIELPAENTQTTKKGGARSDSRGKKKPDSKPGTDVTTVNEEVKPPVFEWKCVTVDGQVYKQNPTTNEYDKIDQLRLILETNPKTSEQVIHREDKVVVVFRSDGSRVVSFADGTRITSYEALEQKQSLNDQETGEFNNSSSSFQRIPHVKVEAFGYATVAFNSQTTDCRTVFSDGSSIDVFSNGTYSIYESDGEKFDINDNGDILFDFQQSIYGKRVQELLPNIEPSKCIMSQNGDIIFDAVDYEQTLYCVESSGETYSKENDEQQQQKPKRSLPLELHVPRFFIAHEDGSGTELLRFKDLYSYLRTMDLDPSTAVVREPLSSNPKVTGATVMRPFQDEVHRRWSTVFEDDSIVPASLRSHTANTATTDSQDNGSFRQTDKCNQSGTFSTGFITQQPILEMPKALDYRNFMEFPRLHDDIRFKLFNSLKAYIEYVTNRADYHTKLLPKDHRNRFEREQANKIWKNARPHGTTKDDLALLYLKTLHPDKQNPATHQSVIPLAKKFNLSHINDELRQEKMNKKLKYDISRGIAMPYFQTEWGIAYTQQRQQQQEEQYTETVTRRESRSAEPTKTFNAQERIIRSPPTSPTDQHNRLSEIRKPLLTRSISTEVAGSKTMNGSDEHNQDSTYRPVKPFQSPRNTVQYDALGNKRANPIRLPNSLKGSRPNAQPHSRFLDMEEPVMVRPNNASIGAATLNNRPLRARRGCELLPDKVDFGILKEGVTYGAEVDIKNVGIDSCRFRVRQPPLGTGLRVVFQPGVLAAGMNRSLTIELYAIIKQNHHHPQQQEQQSQGLYQLDQSIEIITETDIMHFPIRAKIATEEQYDVMYVNNDGTAGMSKSVRLLARKSSNVNDWYPTASKDPTNETKNE
ncbi:unnamed protein product [Adineta ricciae]|uniref:Sperm-associated antigen 17 n=1 Tax=Adineta ricciae TaxID=249248 RepID=A0A813UFV0_ADIRI|nr:unnamed protein product [Adineta ricciae]